MPALSVIDLAMFLLETPERPFNIGPLVVLDPPERERAGFADRLREQMLARAPGIPFNYRLRMPLLGMPSLEPDPGADIAQHVHRISLEPPGSHEQLFAEVCERHEAVLDRSRLLWNLYIFDGLEGGKVAIYATTHHGIIDGRGFVETIANWLATSPTDSPVRAMWEGVPRRANESAVRASVGQRLAGLLSKAGGSTVSVMGLYGMLAQQGLKALGVGSKGLSLPFTGIPKVLRGRSSSKRSFACTTLPLREMKAFGKAHGATLNDVILLSLDIALARYLHDLGQRPSRALVTAMPVALAGAKGGNQIAVLQFPMGAPGLDTDKRLAAIRKETASVKSVIEKESTDTVMLYTTLVHGLPALVERAGLKGGLSVSNLMVSNPFGLAEQRYLMGAPVEMVLPISVVPAGQLLNVTAVSLGERLQLGFLGMPESVPDIGKLAQYTAQACEEVLRSKSQGEVQEKAGPTVARPPAAKRAAAKNAAAKQPPAKKAAANKPAAKKAPAKRPAAKQAAAKKPATKRPAAKRPATAKTARAKPRA
ncbi:wax ester/triacylglycerol synthase family O-acyltransferase [Variovorax sp. J22R133]|uniref:wax ester/triacylglycerol synthase domain-containing protein n=1 Tax=Variovorax brevis TaxID=3053503 RepID=UPI0025778FA5|nr:wax ester/triacylglycerol synthase domain-containing protein [Variovorax sp. J22R133]MDM0117351.1 wax ester/triacylglycerol synthase family O-acyltransferase [Variovorax sp. J22R133]